MDYQLTTSKVQVWRLVGLSCWHRTLVQQQADFIRARLASLGSPSPHLRWEWSDSTSNGTHDSYRLSTSGDWDVLLVSRSEFDPFVHEPYLEKNGWVRGRRVALLWDWTWMHTSSIPCASEAGLSGAVTDPPSLRSWIQVLLTRGATRLQPAHPLLANIAIPSLKSTEA
ncbi:hypothetical protein VN12_09130 [Pirellula sp. SH-Sr6A]|nr:hypothetical protein VN12_09130 [Pirellula sp. SH-Sr6A]